MMKDKCWFVCIPVIVVLAIFITWFFYLFNDRKAINIEYKTCVISQDSTRNYVVADTVYDFMKRADRMEKEIHRLRQNYQSEVNLMVDKANGWLAFWIGVLALVIGLMSIWQIIRQNKSEKEFHRLEENLNKKNEDGLKNARSDFEKEIKDFDGQIQTMRQTLRASKLSSLMMCLSSFPDPQMTTNTSDKKLQMYVVLKHISKTYHEYVESYERDIKDKVNKTEGTYLVLTMVKLAVVRTHGIYSDIHQNITIQKILDYIAETNEMILNGEVTGTLYDRIKKIDMDLYGLLYVIEK